MKKTLLLAPAAAAFLLSACSVPGMGMSASPSPMMEGTSDNSMFSTVPAASGMNMDDQGTQDGQGVMVGGAMMTPDRDIVANAMNASNLTTAVSAIKAADLVATLQGKGPFTVFAPTNDAFSKLPAGTVDTLLKPENKTKLQMILKYHVVSGHYTSADLKDGMKLKTVEGDSLTITKSGDTWMVNDANIVTADVLDSNGVSFVIDSVLMPPTK